MSATELLAELAASQRRTERCTRLIAIVLIAAFLALAAGIVLAVPAAARTVGEIRTAIGQLQNSMQEIGSAAGQLGAITGDQNLANALQALGQIDFETLSSGINRLNTILETLGGFFG